MDFYGVRCKIVTDEYDEESYTEDDDEVLFEDDLTMAIKDSCGFNDKQANAIYANAYQESHSGGYESIVNCAENLANFVRKIINLG